MLLRNALACGLVCGLLGSAGLAEEARSVTTELRVDDAFEAVDLLYVSGSYAVEYTDKADEPAQVGGTYLQIWRRDESGWTIFRETWTNLACAEIRVGPDEDETAAVAATAGAAI